MLNRRGFFGTVVAATAALVLPTPKLKDKPYWWDTINRTTTLTFFDETGQLRKETTSFKFYIDGVINRDVQ